MRIRHQKLGFGRVRVALGTFAGLALALTATPALAGSVNLATRTTLTTVLTTGLTTIANTSMRTSADTLVGTVLNTLNQTFLGTTLDTLTATGSGTLVATGSGTFLSTVIATELGTFLNTNATTITETLFFSAQPLDVSIEINQDPLNLTSPFNNQLTAGALVNRVSVNSAAGITQINAQSGNANVSVATNALIDGPTLVSYASGLSSQVALEIGVLALVPGLALSTAATTAHIAGLALVAAESTATDQEGDVMGLTVELDLVQSNFNEYSSHDNSAQIASVVSNTVEVTGASGISQITAQAGSANVASTHNVLLIDTTFAASDSAVNFNR